MIRREILEFVGLFPATRRSVKGTLIPEISKLYMTLKLLIGHCSHAWSVIVSFKLLIVMFHCQGCCSYELLATLVEPPDVAAEGVLVAEGLHAVLAGHQV